MKKPWGVQESGFPNENENASSIPYFAFGNPQNQADHIRNMLSSSAEFNSILAINWTPFNFGPLELYLTLYNLDADSARF